MAPQLEKLKENNGLTHFKLAEFNNTVLTYNFIRAPFPEIHYATWNRIGANEITLKSRFCGQDDVLNEQQAMRDFCVRSGLIRECDLLANDKLPDFLAMFDRLRNKGQESKDDELLDKLQQQADKIMNEPKDMIVDKQALIDGHGQPPHEPIKMEI